MIKSRRLRWAGHIARMKESRCAINILTGKPIGKRPESIRGTGLIQLRIGIIGKPL